jgi:hypothetical protein
MKILKIQPIEENVMNSEPYPWYVKEGKCSLTAEVMRQDYWSGKPFKFLGFARKGIHEVFICPGDVFGRKRINFKNVDSVFQDDAGEFWSCSLPCRLEFVNQGD